MDDNLKPSELAQNDSNLVENHISTEKTTTNSTEKKAVNPAKEDYRVKIIDVGNPETEEQCEDALNKLLKDLQRITKDANPIGVQKQARQLKQKFDEVHKALLNLKKEKFVSEGGEVSDFKYDHPQKKLCYDVFKNFQGKLSHELKEKEKQQLANYEAKQQIIEDLKMLIDDDHHEGNIFNQFKLLQDRWRTIGDVPRDKYQEMWKIYDFHVERFYDLLHISNDLRDLDLKHNLIEKLKIIERAEALAAMDDVNFAFKELQLLHKLWKEETGPVTKEKREEIWQKFSDVTKKIHDKRHELFLQRKLIHKENASKKTTIINNIDTLDTSANKTNKDWQNSIKEFEDLKASFFAIGQVPLNENQEIWSKFKNATSNFSVKKNKYYSELKSLFTENLKKKQDLLNKALEHKDSEDWEQTSKLMKEIQATWKTVGKTPRHLADKLWSEFREACNYFFDRLHNHQKGEVKKQEEASIEKKQLLEELISNTAEEPETIVAIKELISKWFEFPSASKQKEKIDMKFHNFIINLAKKHKLDELKIDFFEFTSWIKKLKEANFFDEINAEKSFHKKKIAEISKEITQLENNVGFFSNYSADNPLFKNINEEIKSLKQRLELSKKKEGYLERF